VVGTKVIEISDGRFEQVAGSKGRNLHILHAKGFRVPLTYCVTTDAHSDFLTHADAGEKIRETLRDNRLAASEKADRIKDFIEKTDITAEIREELANNRILVEPASRWAVRSSADQEDLPSASFAGLYDSFLDREGLDDIIDSLKRCWASAWNERAIIYRQKNKLSDQVTMAVLIQEMIDARFAGVLFTASPLAGKYGEMYIEYCHGTGDLLAGGRINPYRCTMQRESNAIDDSGSPEGDALGRDRIRTLFELGLEIERLFGCSQDIEWAYDGEKFWILQTRPVTGGRSPREIALSRLWTRANVGEVLPDVVTPLTWTVFRATLYGTQGEMAVSENGPQSESDLVKLVRGRVYMRVDGFFDSFCYLPFVTPETMGQVLGVTLPVAAGSYRRPRGLRVRMAQAVFILAAGGFYPRLSLLLKELPSLTSAVRGGVEGLIAWNALCFRLHLKSTAYAIGAFGMINRALQRWLPSEAGDLLPLILIGHEDLQTAAQGLSLRELADYARKNTALRETIEHAENWKGIFRELPNLAGGPEFLSMLQSFYKVHGARTAGEFELALPRWREDHSFVMGMIRKFLEACPTDSSGIRTERRKQREEAIARIMESISPLRRWIFGRLLNSYGAFATMRENVKYRLMEGFAELRGLLLEIGERLETRGLLEESDHIFFLELGEIRALAKEGDGTTRSVAMIARERMELQDFLKEQDAPFLIDDEAEEIGCADGGGGEGDTFAGVGCSPGEAQGFARVILDISEAKLLEADEILIAPHADPGWTPLFLNCRAVVTAIGGFLSHGATVAREYGVPAVVNVTDVTTKIHTGDLVRVNGTQGLVAVVKRCSPYEKGEING